MAPSILRRLALAGMVALLVGAAPLAQTPEPAQDDVKALRILANAGDGEAQYLLGMRCYHGEDVPQDHVEAAAWFRQSAEQGNADAQYTLGVMYANGEGVP